MIITIDGPSGTGKGTLCHRLAEHLGWNVLDSGAIYRVLAYAARKNNIHLDSTHELTKLADNLALKFKTTVDYNVLVYLDNEDITHQIRTEQCGQDASYIAANPAVRVALLARQRAFAQEPGLVADGRDLGTVVFPHAKLKIYLDASPEQRAQRRYLQLKKQGNNVSLAQVVEELSKRDQRDIMRAHAPLVADSAAVCIDTTKLSADQTFEKIVELCAEYEVFSGGM
jgi:CMP/dCMP kinase